MNTSDKEANMRFSDAKKCVRECHESGRQFVETLVPEPDKFRAFKIMHDLISASVSAGKSAALEAAITAREGGE